jgi:hypothetical protein
VQFLAAFFEHFVVGVFAIICFSIFFINPDLPEEYLPLVNNLENIKELLAIVLLPTSYLIGTFIDALASISGKVINYYFGLFLSKVSCNQLREENLNNPNCSNNSFAQTLNGLFLKYIRYPISKIFNKNSYIRTVKILQDDNCTDELAKYFLQLNSRQKITRGVVFIMSSAVFYSISTYGFFSKQTSITIVLTLLSWLVNLWHTHTLENFKSRFNTQ